MADPSSGSERRNHRASASGPAPATPRWVKVSGIVVVFLALIVVVMLLLGHGPGRHSAAGAASGLAFPAGSVVVLAELVGGR